jgi:hypothetical protein
MLDNFHQHMVYFDNDDVVSVHDNQVVDCLMVCIVLLLLVKLNRNMVCFSMLEVIPDVVVEFVVEYILLLLQTSAILQVF